MTFVFLILSQTKQGGVMSKNSKGYNMKTILKDQVIFKEGDPGSDAYLIRKGTVDIYKVMNNKKVLLERLQPGEIFGEMAILSGEPRSAHAMASEYVELVVINRNDLEVSIQKSLPIVQALSKLLIKRLRRTNDMIQEQPTTNIFRSFCNILFLHYQSRPTEKENEDDIIASGLIYSDMVKNVSEIISLSKVEVDAVVKYLTELQLVEIIDEKLAPKVIKKVLVIKDPETFMETTAEYAKEWNPETGTFLQDIEFAEIGEFARMISLKPKEVIVKIAKGKIPMDIVYVHKTSAIAWAEKNVGPLDQEAEAEAEAEAE